MIEMIPFYILGAVSIRIATWAFPGICRIDWARIKEFSSFMLTMTILRIVVWTAMHRFFHIPINGDIGGLNFLTYFGVYWEDAIFTLPILVLDRFGISTMTRNLLFLFSSVSFAAGHLYEGGTWALATLAYVPFISYKYGNRYGLGTCMVGHVMYDMLTSLAFLALTRIAHYV